MKKLAQKAEAMAEKIEGRRMSHVDALKERRSHQHDSGIDIFDM
jgi:hypothetical protein